VVTRLLLIVLCLGVLSTVTGCSVEPTAYATSSDGGGQGTRRGTIGNNGRDRMVSRIIRGNARLVAMPSRGAAPGTRAKERCAPTP
jgi:hypothetical protein